MCRYKSKTERKSGYVHTFHHFCYPSRCRDKKKGELKVRNLRNNFRQGANVYLGKKKIDPFFLGNFFNLKLTFLSNGNYKNNSDSY